MLIKVDLGEIWQLIFFWIFFLKIVDFQGGENILFRPRSHHFCKKNLEEPYPPNNGVTTQCYEAPYTPTM